ncbi:MAG: hypothetical protein M1839_008589 [Geoglossum umbratile]|nr:MAG: hypothetical protein M1839_008589 [Geoglossum umbratile]
MANQSTTILCGKKHTLGRVQLKLQTMPRGAGLAIELGHTLLLRHLMSSGRGISNYGDGADQAGGLGDFAHGTETGGYQFQLADRELERLTASIEI